MKSLDADKKGNKVSESTVKENCDQIATKEEKIDFSNVKIEPLFEEEVDFDTFSKSDFRAVKVKECVAVPKSKKLLQFTLDDGTGVDRTRTYRLNLMRLLSVQIKKYGGEVLAVTNGRQALRVVLMEKNARYVPVRE